MLSSERLKGSWVYAHVAMSRGRIIIYITACSAFAPYGHRHKRQKVPRCPCRLTQETAASSAAMCHQFSHDAQRDFFRRPGPDIQTDGGKQPVQSLLRQCHIVGPEALYDFADAASRA